MKYLRYSLSLFIILFAAYSACAEKANDDNSLQDYLTNGFTYIKLGEYKKAVDELEKAIKQDSSSVDAHYFLAYAYQSYGIQINKEGNEKVLTDIFMNPKHKEPTDPRESEHFKESQKYLNKSTDHYKIVVKLDPTHWAGLYAVAIHYLSYKQYDKAIDNYKLAIKYNTNYSHSYSGIASAYFGKDMYIRAEENYKNAILIDPDFDFYHYELGLTYLKSNQRTKALEVLAYLKSRESTYYDDLKNLLDEEQNNK